MKALKTISTIALAALVLASCQEKELEVSPVLTPESNSLCSIIKIGEEFTVTATKPIDETKTVLQSDNSIYWSPGDQITLAYGDSEDFATGVFTANITEPAATATFTGTLNMVLGNSEELGGGSSNPSTKHLYGVYPASSEVAIGKTSEGYEYVVVPFNSFQEAVEDSFDPTGMATFAQSDNLDLRFNNIASILAITIQEEGITDIKVENIDKSISGIGCALNGMGFFPGSNNVVHWMGSGITHMVSLAPPFGQETFEKGKTYNMAILPGTYKKGVKFTLSTAGDPIELYMEKELTVERSKIYPVTLQKMQVALRTVCEKRSGDAAWNSYFNGTPGSDRNIAMDDNYVYIAENAATPKLWAISISNPNDVVEVNVTGVSGGTHALACPRVIQNTDWAVNNGNDVLVCSNLTRGGEDPKLYMWVNGINNPPKAITLTTWATGAWYGDVFTVYGTLQNGILMFDKIGGDNANGIVTFLLNGVPSGDVMYLVSRMAFNDAYGSHSGACAYYPFPGTPGAGIYSPGRGNVVRGKSVSISTDIKAEGAHTTVLADLNYSSGRNGCVLGYNFIEWGGHRYVIYGKQESSTLGKVYVLEGPSTLDWLTISNRDWDGGEVKYRRDLKPEDGSSFTSGNSGMDVTARVINGHLFIAAQKQNVAFGLYELYYTPVE